MALGNQVSPKMYWRCFSGLDTQFFKNSTSMLYFSIEVDGEITSKFNMLYFYKIFGGTVRQFMWVF